MSDPQMMSVEAIGQEIAEWSADLNARLADEELEVPR